MNERLCAANDFEVIEQFAIIGEQCGDGFRGVDCRTAAKTDYKITTRGARPEGAVGDVVERGFARDCKIRGGDTLRVQNCVQKCRPLCVAAGDDQRVSAEFAGRGANFAQRSVFDLPLPCFRAA